MNRVRTHAWPTTQLLAWCFVVFVLVEGGGQAGAQAGCLEFVPPPLFDASQFPPGPEVPPNTMGLLQLGWNGHRHLIHDLGNDLEILGVDDPLNPGLPVDSLFAVPPFGDYDYNLYNFSVCDECRFGIAGFGPAGTVLFDLGIDDTPSFGGSHLYSTAQSKGGLTFRNGTQQYLVAAEVLDVCNGGAALMSFDGVDPADLALLQCVDDAAGAPVTVDGGFYIPGAPDYVYLVDGYQVQMYRVSGSGSDLRLEALGAVIHASWMRWRGIALDLDAPPPWYRLAVAASPVGLVELWNLSDPGAPEILAQWDPNPSLAWLDMGTVAIKYPHIWVGALFETTTTGSTHTYDIGDPGSPQELDSGFWDGSKPWNSCPGSANVGAVFSEDGEWLFLSRRSVLERIHLCQFADDFESGDTTAWSLLLP